MTAARMLVAGALLGALAVLLGAYAAHGLKGVLGQEQLAWFETGVRYQMYHALALLACGLMARSGGAPRWSAQLFLGGTLLFSGSLYLLALTDIRWLGAVTPLGGVCLVGGWLLLLRAARQPA